MEEVKKTKKPSTKKDTKKKKEEVIEKAQEQPQIDMDKMFQMFQMFMTQMQQPQQETVKEVKVGKSKQNKDVKKNKSYLRRERKDDEVVVRSMAGTVCYKSPKTGITYKWYDIGDEELLTIEEVLQMEISSKKYLHSPWLMVEDDEVNEILGINQDNDIDTLINIDNILEELTLGEIEEILNKSSDGYKKSFVTLIMNKIRDEELRDSVLIRELGRMLKIDFELYK